MEGKSRIRKQIVFKTVVILSICATVYYWMVESNVFSRQTLCTSQQVSYTRSNLSNNNFTPSFSKTDQPQHKDLQPVSKVIKAYQHFHKSQRQRMALGEPIQSLTWYCISDCNGIGDQIMGIYGAFILALAMNRTFFIHQSDEIQETMFIEPNAIDWRPVRSCVTLHPDETVSAFGQASLLRRKLLRTSDNFHLEINQLQSKENIFISGKHMIQRLIASIARSAIAVHNLPLQELLQLMTKSGLNLHHVLSMIHQFLFHVPLAVVKEANLTLTRLNLQPQKYVSLHIRTGFKNSFLGEIVFSKEFFKGNRFARTKATWRQMMNCAIRIANAKFGNGSLILVSSDDQEPKSWAEAEYKTRVKTLDIKPVHVGRERFLAADRRSNNASYIENWVELLVMSQSFAMVSIPSGFPEVASHIGFINPLSLYTYNIAGKTCVNFAKTDWLYRI